MRKLIIALLILAAVLVSAFLYLRHGHVYEVSEADIQSRVETQFPVEKCVLVFCLELDRPFVKLTEGSTRIEFGADALMEIAFSSDKYDGNAGFSGELSYIAGEGAFYLTDSRLEFLEVKGVSDKHKDNLDQLAVMIVSEYLRTNPIYSFRDSPLELVAPWLELKEVEVRAGVLRVRLGLAG
ncbi:MAG TPA: DUF1439 domain-containing protein [Arenicellales bacterium]|nr:DUF1439 domain-containing protein [Arenicellales bacterium]